MENNKNRTVKRDPAYDKHMSGEVILSPVVTYEWDCPICESHNTEIGCYSPQYVACPDCMKWFRYIYEDDKVKSS